MPSSSHAEWWVHEPLIRGGVFAGVFLLMSGWELLARRRALRLPRARRWVAHFGLVVIGTLAVRVLFPTAAVGVALFAEARAFGLFNLTALPGWLVVPASLIVLDLAIYAQHALFHFVPPLWRVHRVHHADLDFDVSTGIRFHPLEIVLSMVIKLAVVVLLGIPPVAVLIFEVVLNATSLFTHANARLPTRLERGLRWVCVTPEMHRVHHSIDPDETNSNFGFNLSLWDRIFGTYRDRPRAGHEGLRFGLEPFQHERVQTLGWMLRLPFERTSDPFTAGNKSSPP